MKRLLAIAAFFAGGLAAELRHPLHCTLLHVSRMQPRRRAS